MSEKYNSGLYEIQYKWSFQDLIEAHEFLNLVQKEEQKAIDKANKKR